MYSGSFRNYSDFLIRNYECNSEMNNVDIHVYMQRVCRQLELLRSIVNQSTTMTGNTTYDMAIHNVKNRTNNILRGANRYGVLEDSDDEECTNKEVQMSDLLI